MDTQTLAKECPAAKHRQHRHQEHGDSRPRGADPLDQEVVQDCRKHRSNGSQCQQREHDACTETRLKRIFEDESERNQHQRRGDKRTSRAARFVKRWEEHAKGMFVPSTLFEEMGLHYTGPIDGHDLPALLQALKLLKGQKGPRLLHVITTKGKGYELAEGDQIGYHAVGPFDPANGLVGKTAAGKPTYTDVFSDWVCDAAAADPVCGKSEFHEEVKKIVLQGRQRPAEEKPLVYRNDANSMKFAGIPIREVREEA